MHAKYHPCHALIAGLLLSGCYIPCNDAARSGTWEREIPGLSGTTIIQSSDGGYLIAGSIRGTGFLSRSIVLTKLDDSGTESWTTTFPDKEFSFSNHVFEAADQTIILSGTADGKAYAARVDSDGEILWSRTVEESGEHVYQAPYLTALTDGNFALASYNQGPERYNYPSHIVKLDLDGDVIWTRILNAADDTRIVAMLPGPNGNINVFTDEFDYAANDKGTKLTPAGERHFRIAQLGAADGTTAWEILDSESFGALAPADDGGFISYYRNEMRLYDADGVLVSERQHGVANFAGYYTKFRPAAGGGYILGGYNLNRRLRLFNDCGNMLAAKLDAEGEILWEREYGTDAMEYLQDIAPTSDGGFVLLGLRAKNLDSWRQSAIITRVEGDN